MAHLRYLMHLVRNMTVYCAALLLCSFASMNGANAQPTGAALSVATIPTEVAAQVFYAHDRGDFQRNGLNVAITSLQNGPAIISAVVAGSEDIGFSNAFSLIVAHDKGLPVVVLCGTDLNGASQPTNGILAVSDTSGIRSAADLKGKIVGVSSLSNTNFYALKNWIDQAGGDSKAVHYVELPLPEMADAVGAGRIDAASMDAANLHSHKNLRQLAATYSSVAPRFIAGAWFSTPAWIHKNPQLARSFVAAIQSASIWANNNHHDAVSIYAKHSRYTLEDLEASPRPVFVTTTQPQLFQPLIDLAARYGAIRHSFPAKELVDDSSR